jgi:hypothetical protein
MGRVSPYAGDVGLVIKAVKQQQWLIRLLAGHCRFPHAERETIRSSLRLAHNIPSDFVDRRTVAIALRVM